MAKEIELKNLNHNNVIKNIMEDLSIISEKQQLEWLWHLSHLINDKVHDLYHKLYMEAGGKKSI